LFTIKLQKEPETVEKPGDNPGDKLKENTRKKVLEIMSIKGIVINRKKEELADLIFHLATSY